MSNLNVEVKNVVDDFVHKDMLFTALDVSNKVKETLPHARHSEVRDIVRDLFTDMMQSNYTRTTIQVSLNDGSTTEALLYHPLSDSWDLDAKYDQQKRCQQSNIPTITAPSTPRQLWSKMLDTFNFFKK